METIKELYWEALRAPATPVNIQRNPYMRQNLIKKRLGKTREERVAKMAENKRNRKAHMREVDAAVQRDEELGIGTPAEHQQKRVDNAKARRKLGFIDMETDENGNTVLAQDGNGVEDKVLEDLNIKSSSYLKQVQENKDRKKIDIITPVAGIGKSEYKKDMLRSEEFFKDV